MSLAAAQAISIGLYGLMAAMLLAAELARSPRWSRAFAWAALPAGAAAIAALMLLSPHGGPWSPAVAAAQTSGRQTLTLVLGRGGGSRVVVRHGGDGGTLAEATPATGDGPDGVAAAGGPAGWQRDGAVATLDVVRDCPDCPELVIVPAGDGAIGAARSEAGATSAELPRQIMRFWPGFAIGRFEISVAQYARFAAATGRPQPACAGEPQGHAADPDAAAALPVRCITAGDAAAFAAWLKSRTGKPFRLPSASEWEYAARSGGMDLSVAHSAAPAAAIVRAASARGEWTSPLLKPVSGGQPTAWGIFGMEGNVAEMVADCWHDTLDLAPPTGRAYAPHALCAFRLLKDGADNEDARWRRAAARRPWPAGTASPGVGFRIARDLR